MVNIVKMATRTGNFVDQQSKRTNSLWSIDRLSTYHHFDVRILNKDLDY